MVTSFQVDEQKNTLLIRGVPAEKNNYKISFDKTISKISQITLFDGMEWHEIVAEERTAGDNWMLPVKMCEIAEKKDDYLKVRVTQESDAWRMESEYEFFARGYVVCTFSLEALIDQAEAGLLTAGIPLDEESVFSHKHRVLNMMNDPDDRRSIRALSVDFSTDERPVTGSVNFLLETVTNNMQGLPCRKILSSNEGCRYLGWELSQKNAYPCPKGYRYNNRWALTLTTLGNKPGSVRAQRIYHYYGVYPRYPSDDLLDEMSEYGCSLLALHTPFSHISGSQPADDREMSRVVQRAHELGIKVIFYCQPYLISIEAPYHNEYAGCRTECLRVWHCMKETQIVNYDPDTSYDCDELCLRCARAFDFIYNTVIDCWKKFGFDGLYIDFAWPSHGLCNDTSHGHAPGLFNFYDYWRMLRKWRKAIGPESIMIGHGGGLLVSSDFIEGFDACLTGEAQKELDPVIIGQQIGLPPTLWPMHRRKQDTFRSSRTIEQLIREGMTPHTGLGIMGTSILATVDPAHHRELIALWQMWRGFPVHRAAFHNYLTEKVLELDNGEMFYSLYVTEKKEILLILVNAGGPEHDRSPAIGVNVRFNTGKLDLPGKMNCWRMKGNTYETFRIARVEPVVDGRISVPELLLHEFIGFILTPGDPPEELTKLMNHLEGRWKRLPALLEAKQKRMVDCDRKLDDFAKLPIAANKLKYDEFIKNRVAE